MARKREAGLTTTAYGILGVLAVQPRSAYELATEMRHCFEYFWGRDEVRVYSDAKRLAALGLVAVRRELIGRRPHTSYRITPAGRRELRRWLRRPSRPIGLEFEGLIKVYLARFGTLEDLRATVEQVRADSAYMLQVATNVRHAYLTGCAPFQTEYQHVWFFVYDFLSSYFQMVGEWAERTLSAMAAWKDLDPTTKRERALDLFVGKVPAPGLRPDFAAKVEGVLAMPGMWHRRTASSRS